ncbi:MAG: rhodanese-related sulfurtransferase [Rickettsiales bacterium]|jgi:rhodanese-related sulfurtransferase
MVLQITAPEAWKILETNSESILIDVRTREEIDFVGFTHLSKINAKTIFLPWKQYPQMSMDATFTDKLEALIAEIFPSNPTKTNLLFLCRSGGRSLESAMFMDDLGYENCYNITDGFEGSHDEFEQRGKINGWKAKNLPWKQN